MPRPSPTLARAAGRIDAALLRRARLSREPAQECVNGWGSTLLDITPDGTALPCHTARMLPGLAFPNVRDASVREIWFESEGFNRYRGTGWMKEPCSTCEHREQDLGGCRCQAYLIAAMPAPPTRCATRVPHHHKVIEAVMAAEAAAAESDGAASDTAGSPARPTEFPLVFRDPANSRRLAGSVAG